MTDDPRPRYSSRRAAAAAPLRSSSSALRSHEPENARLDVLCGGRCIARVLDRGELLNAAIEVPASGPINLLWVDDGIVLLVDCRCSTRHKLDGAKLAAAAWAARPGQPRVIAVRDVSVL